MALRLSWQPAACPLEPREKYSPAWSPGRLDNPAGRFQKTNHNYCPPVEPKGPTDEQQHEETIGNTHDHLLIRGAAANATTSK